MRERVLKVFREVFGDDELVVTESTTAKDVQGWDSFNHITLTLRLEEEFGVSFTTREIGSMARVGDLYALLETKLNSSDGGRTDEDV